MNIYIKNILIMMIKNSQNLKNKYKKFIKKEITIKIINSLNKNIHFYFKRINNEKIKS